MSAGAVRGREACPATPRRSRVERAPEVTPAGGRVEPDPRTEGGRPTHADRLPPRSAPARTHRERRHHVRSAADRDAGGVGVGHDAVPAGRAARGIEREQRRARRVDRAVPEAAPAEARSRVVITTPLTTCVSGERGDHHRPPALEDALDLARARGLEVTLGPARERDLEDALGLVGEPRGENDLGGRRASRFGVHARSRHFAFGEMRRSQQLMSGSRRAGRSWWGCFASAVCRVPADVLGGVVARTRSILLGRAVSRTRSVLLGG